jgi:transposase-like protein
MADCKFKAAEMRVLFPSDEAAFELLYLSLRNLAKRWATPIKNLDQARQAFAIIYEGRGPTLDGQSFTQSL